MRILTTLLLLLTGLSAAILAGCQVESERPAGSPQAAQPPTPTPEVGVTLATRAPATADVMQITPTPLPTATSTPTATPIIYRVEEGDTLLGIALENFTTVEEIEAINPGVVPELLQIGQELQLPPPATPIFQGEASTPIPLQVRVVDVAVYRTPAGSMWLLGEVVNEGEYPVASVQLQIDLHGASGDALGSVPAWAALPLVPAGAKAPFGVLVREGPAGDVEPAVAVTGGEALGDVGSHYLDLAAMDVEATLDDGRVSLDGTVANQGERTAGQIVVVATFYDAQGRVSGYAQQTLDEALAPGATAPFSFAVTPPGGQTTDYELAVQGLHQQPAP